MLRVVQARDWGARRCPTECRASAAGHTGPQQIQSKLRNASRVVALKDWAVTLHALRTGEQQVLLRKGGIREKGFGLEADLFALFPTAFHSEASLVTSAAALAFPPGLRWDPKAEGHIPIHSFAQIEAVYLTKHTSVLEALAGHHVWTPAFLETRLKWRGAEPITVLLLRVWNLAQPLLLPQDARFWGCFSWVDITEGVQGADLTMAPALDAARWEQVKQSVSASMEALGAELDVGP